MTRTYLLEKPLEVFFEVFPLRAIMSGGVLMHVKKYHSLKYHSSTHLLVICLIILRLRFWGLSSNPLKSIWEVVVVNIG